MSSDTAVAPGADAPSLVVGEQFDDAPQQQAAASLGMWLFLATEIMFFGALFMAYAIARVRFPDAFAAASRHTELVLGTANTAILLTSSAFMALAVEAARVNARKLTMVLLLVTAVLGAVFGGIKLTEYVIDYRDHLVPWLDFAFDPRHATGASIFFSLYFTMTGLHLVHLVVGIALVLAVAWGVGRQRRNVVGDHVEIVGLYWHFVDIVWIFLYPCLYLISRA